MNTANRIALVLMVMSCIGLSVIGCGSNSSNTTAPANPSGVTATAGNAQVIVNWEPIPNASFYRVYEGIAPGVTKDTAIGTIELHREPPFIIDSGNGIPHYFVMTAVNSAGESILSTEVSATPDTGLAAPSAPTEVAATAGDGKVTISWSPVIGATRYNINYATATGVTKTSNSKTPLQGYLTLQSGRYIVAPQTVSGLTNGITYFFIVTAENSNGESIESAEVSATPTGG